MRRKIKNWVSRCSKLSLGCKLMMVLLLFTHFAFSSENAFGQQTITVQFEKQSLSEVLSVLKQKTSFEFLYNDEEIKSVTNITRSFTNASIQEVLKSCLTGTKYGFKIVDNLIVITPDDKKKDGVEKLVVRGKVVDDAGQTLPGVTILLKGTTIGVVTDIDGKFKMELPKQDSLILIFSFVGMETQNLDVNKIKDLSKEVTVRMKADVTEMDEVVVTGYVNMKKQSFTGNAITVKKDDLLKVSQTNVISALQTFDPSLRIATNNIWGSDPNAVPELYLRGRSGIGVMALDKDQLSKSSLESNPNLPTFIMDGFEVKVEKVYDMDPSRIESVTILKDAAATAMYGSRAANGVIVITTVAPKPGRLSVNYSMVGTLQMPDLSDYNIANAEEKLEIERLAGMYDYKEGDALETYYSKLSRYNEKKQAILEGVDTYWLSKPLRTSFNHKHSLYVEGGSQQVRYGLDFSYNGDNGVMKESYRNTTSVGFTIDFRLKSFQVRNFVSYSIMKKQESPYGSFSDYARALPYDRYKDENGNYLKELKNWGSASSRLNPLYESTLYNHDRAQYDEFVDNFQANWYINDFLQLKGQFSVTKKYDKSDRFVDPNSTKATTTASASNQLSGDLYLSNSEATDVSANAFVAYNRNVEKHNLNFNLGVEAKISKSERLALQYRGFPSGQLSSANYAAEVVGKPAKTQAESRLAALIGALNYSYDNIYLFDVSCRFDGSSEFGTDKKVAPFWSGGVGINIHNYEFMKDFGFFNNLRISGSYGQVGKGNFPAYCATTMYQSLTDDWYITGYGVKLKYLGNPNLKWEKTNTLDMKIEVGVLNGLFELKAGYYNKKTIDLITDVTLPTSSGFVSYKDNAGKLQNRGYELDFRANILNKKDYSFAVYGNLAHNENKMLEISDAMKRYNDRVDDIYSDRAREHDEIVYDSSEARTKYVEGGSTTSIFGMRSLGIDPATGKELLLKKDGTITHTYDPSQQVILGDTEAKYQGAFGFNARYKNFTLFASFLYELGGQVYNQTLVNAVENADIENSNVDKRVLTQRWQKPGDITPLKDIKDRTQTTRPSSRFIQDNKVLSLSAITLSYEFNHDLIKRWGLSMARFEVSSNDLFYSSTVRQERGTSYPFARSVNFSLRVGF